MKKGQPGGELLAKSSPANMMMKRRKIFTEVIAALFILLFVYTAINKIHAAKTMRLVIKKYPLIGSWGELIIWGLPSLEFIIAGLLFFPATRRMGLWSTLLLMISFTLYIIYMFIYSPTLPCTCGGMLQTLSWPGHIVFNVSCIGLAALGLWSKGEVINETESYKPVFT